MKQLFPSVRKPGPPPSSIKSAVNTTLVTAFGLGLGLFSKILDSTASNELPYIIETLDVSNFFGRLAVWVLLAAVIAMYSRSPLRASLHVLLFFAGMLVSYFSYTILVLGFNPRSYIRFWAILTLLSPVPAYICWYARGKGRIGLIIGACLSGFLFKQAFSFGAFYFGLKDPLDMAVWVISLAVLYQNPRQFIKLTGLSIVFGLLWGFINPYGMF